MSAVVPTGAQIAGARRLDRGVALQDDADRLVGLGGGLRAGDRLRTAERKRRHDARKQHDVARRQEDQRAVRQIKLGAGGRLRPRLLRLVGRGNRLPGLGGLNWLFDIVHGDSMFHSTKLGEGQHEAAVHQLARGKAQAGGQGDAALEAAIRDLQSYNIGIPLFAGQGAGPGDHQHLALDLDANRLGGNAREERQ